MPTRRVTRNLKVEAYALYLAMRHPGTPWCARAVAAGVIAYALSPIDLIPDFIPVLGHLDDAILLPLGVALAVRLIPGEVMIECRARAAEALASVRPVLRAAAIVVVATWVFLVVLAGWLVFRLLRAR